MKKVFSSIFVLAMMVAMLPVGTAFAANESDPLCFSNRVANDQFGGNNSKLPSKWFS